jgi:oligopeptidase B
LPAILATAGLHDPRVAYWEPAKWIQTLRYNRRMALGPPSPKERTVKGDGGCAKESELPPLLLKMDLDAGHFSASDRYNHLRELAFGWAFLLDRLSINSTAVYGATSRQHDGSTNSKADL